MLKNYLYNLTYQILTLILPILTIPYITRVLGPANLGTYALTYSYAQYFALFGMLGLTLYSCREVTYAKNDNARLKEVFWELNILRVLTVGLALIIYVFIFVIILDSYKVLYLIQSLIIISYLVDISWYFIGLEDFKSVVVRNTAVKFVGIALIFILVKDSNDLWLYTLILGMTQLIGQLVMWFKLLKGLKIIIPKMKRLILHLRSTIKLFIPQIAIIVYTLADKILLGIITDEVQVGYYDNSQKMIKMLIAIVTTIATVSLPRLALLYSKGQIVEFKDYVHKTFSIASFLAFPMAFGLIGISKIFIPWFYGMDFIDIVPLFYVGALLMISLAWSSIVGNQVLISARREREFTIAVSSGALINILLSFLLVAKYKALGTTISTVAAEFTGLAIMIYFIRDIIDVKRLINSSMKYFGAAIIMLILIWPLAGVFKPGFLSSFTLIILGGSIYIGIMTITNDINIKYLEELVSRLKTKTTTQKMQDKYNN